MARLSVVIPTYNHAKYISDAIESVLNQEFDEVEIVVVDDGSTDITQVVLQKYSHSPMRVIKQQNQGLLRARNRGILESTSPIIYFLDADDLLLPGSLRILFEIMENQSDVGLVTGGTIYFELDGKNLDKKILKPNSLSLSEILMNNPITVSGVMARKSWLVRVGGFESCRNFDPAGDWDLWIRLAYEGCKFEWIEKPIVAYRIHPDQMTQDPYRMRESMLSVLNKFYSKADIPDKLKDLKPKAYSNVFVKSACRYFFAGMFEKGMSDLGEAIILDSRLCESNYRELMNMLLGWAYSPQSKDPIGFLEMIKNNLPKHLKHLVTPLKRALASAILKPLFFSSKKDLTEYRRELIRVVRNDMSLLLNRGVVRLLIEAWFPILGR